MTTTSRRPAVPATDASAPRLHSLDALRAGALLLGVVLHSLLPFMPGMPWMFQDSQQTAAAGLPPFVIHLFRMVLFMMLAGYFGRMVLHRRGAGPYVRDRLRRIGLPLVVFAPLTLVALIVVLGLGAALGLVAAGTPPPPPPGVPEILLMLNPGHLWFLLVLIELVLLTVTVRAVLLRVLGADRAGRWSGRLGSLLSSPAGLVVAAVPYALGVLAQGTSVGGIIQPFTILPAPGATIAYLGAFLTGWFLHARPDALERVDRRWVPALVLAVLLSVAAFVAPFAVDPSRGVGLVVVAALTALAGWSWVFGLLGLCARLLDREVPAVRYAADASYWIYLLHLPLLAAVGIALAGLGWPILVKLAITWTVTLAVLLLSYDLLVRPTWIGAWLNGRRRPRAILRASGRGADAA
jgi:glucans biosynthesis protein C